MTSHEPSTPQRPDEASEPTTPTAVERESIERTATDAHVRRAPRYRAFFWTGALVGIVAGVVLGVVVSDAGMVNRGIYVVVTVLGTTLVTTLAAGTAAVLADRRSVRPPR